jgi:hypothetical protein
MLVTVGARPRDGLRKFIEYLDVRCQRRDTEYVVVGWNLSYEWTQLFGDLDAFDDNGIDVVQESQFELNVGRRDDAGNALSRWHIKALNDKMYTATFRNESTHVSIRVIDGMKYFVTGLSKAGEMLGLGRKLDFNKEFLAKMTREEGLRNPAFLAYARQDAYLTRKIGEYIVSDLHETYDVPTCISAPQFASRVFRRSFLNVEIPPPSPDLEQAGLYSYHGGKNGYYLGGPHKLDKVWSLDITSAYPEAMRALPNIETASWVAINDWQPGRHALYRVTLKYEPCTYRPLYDHGGARAEGGYVSGVWITSYELDSIMRHGEAVIVSCDGFEMVGDVGKGPLAEYVDRFFGLKARSTGALREAAKLFLNSLYGKFFQKVPRGNVGYWDIDLDGDGAALVETDPTQDYDYDAGGLYHPPIASLITGFVRAKIHDIEHKYDALMTSTDGIFARRRPDPADVGTDLGKLTAERGTLRVWRERLYIFDPSPRDDSGKYRKVKRKVALHGFRGNADMLAAVPLTPGRFEYTGSQLVTLRLARRSFTTPDGSSVVFPVGTIPTLKYILDNRPRSP